MTTEYVRVTVTSQRRRAEMLLPSDRQVAELMPQVLRTLGSSAASAEIPQSLSLTPLGAATLTAHQSLDEAGIGNGAILAVDRGDEAVPRPVIYDLAEETEQFSAPTVGRLEVDLGRLISVTVFTVFGLTALVMAVTIFDVVEPAWWSLGTAVATLVALAVLPSRILPWDVELLVLSASSLLLSLIWGLPGFGGSEWTIPIWVFLALTSWLVSRRLWLSTLTTFSAAAILASLWWGSGQLFNRDEQIVAVAGAGSVILLGLAPRVALVTSGMHRLDDEVTSGERPAIPRAREAFLNAHAGLAAAVVLCAGSAASAVHGLVSDDLDRWSLPLAVFLTALTALRARSMPLALERAALVAAASLSAVVILLATAEHIPTWILLAAPIIIAVLPLGLHLVTVPAHTGARLRIYSRRLEGLATLALVPLLLGLFGIFSQLLETFQD